MTQQAGLAVGAWTISPAEPRGLKARVNEFERQIILDALRSAGGNKRRAAASLGVLPTTLHEKMKRLGIGGAPTS